MSSYTVRLMVNRRPDSAPKKTGIVAMLPALHPALMKYRTTFGDAQLYVRESCGACARVGRNGLSDIVGKPGMRAVRLPI